MDSRNNFTIWTRNREMGCKKKLTKQAGPTINEKIVKDEQQAEIKKAQEERQYQQQVLVNERGQRFVGGGMAGRDEYFPGDPIPEYLDNELEEQEVLGSRHQGGMIHKTGLYRLHKGEMVIPKKDVKKYVRSLYI